MNTRFGLNIAPGGFNEQVLVRGLGDLHDARIGDQVIFSSGVVLRVTDNAWPCEKLSGYHNEPLLVRELAWKDDDGNNVTKRGILAEVMTPGELMPGDIVIIKRTTDTHTLSSQLSDQTS